MSSWHVDGLQQLEMKLRELPQKIAKKYVRRAVAAGGRIIRDEMRRRAPVKHDIGGIGDVGELRRSIQLSTNTKANGSEGEATAKIGPKGKVTAFAGTKKQGRTAKALAYWLEFGVDEHEIKASRKKVLSNERKFFGRTVKHPGFSPRPFMRPAADSKKGEAVDAVAKVLKDAIDTEAKSK